jgi:hypothetical protein
LGAVQRRQRRRSDLVRQRQARLTRLTHSAGHSQILNFTDPLYDRGSLASFFSNSAVGNRIGRWKRFRRDGGPGINLGQFGEQASNFFSRFFGLVFCSHAWSPAFVISLSQPGSTFLIPVNIMRDNAGILGRHGRPILIPQRALGILVAALPMLAHRCTGKLVILRVSFTRFLLINEL